MRSSKEQLRRFWVGKGVWGGFDLYMFKGWFQSLKIDMGSSCAESLGI